MPAETRTRLGEQTKDKAVEDRNSGEGAREIPERRGSWQQRN